jgi:hypothetical protein
MVCGAVEGGGKRVHSHHQTGSQQETGVPQSFVRTHLQLTQGPPTKPMLSSHLSNKEDTTNRGILSTYSEMSQWTLLYNYYIPIKMLKKTKSTSQHCHTEDQSSTCSWWDTTTTQTTVGTAFVSCWCCNKLLKLCGLKQPNFFYSSQGQKFKTGFMELKLKMLAELFAGI